MERHWAHGRRVHAFSCFSAWSGRSICRYTCTESAILSPARATQLVRCTIDRLPTQHTELPQAAEQSMSSVAARLLISFAKTLPLPPGI